MNDWINIGISFPVPGFSCLPAGARVSRVPLPKLNFSSISNVPSTCANKTIIPLNLYKNLLLIQKIHHKPYQGKPTQCFECIMKRFWNWSVKSSKKSV